MIKVFNYFAVKEVANRKKEIKNRNETVAERRKVQSKTMIAR